MAASVQFRPQNRDLGMVMREVDEDLAIFLGIPNGERERNDCLLVEESHEFDDSRSADPKPDGLLSVNASQKETFLIEADDNFLNLDTGKSDNDWLLMQPDTFQLPPVEANVQDSAATQAKIPNGEGISLKSELENTCEVSACLSDSSSQLATSTGPESSTAANRRPLSLEERKPTRRAVTPTGRPSLSAKSKPSRASTPTPRANLSSKPVADQTRSSTPVRPASRSSTPASRPSIPVIKSVSRSATPTRKQATPSLMSTISASDRSSSGRKPGTTILKSSLPSRGTSPTVKSRPSKPSEMLSLSHDASQNPKESMPKRRPASASRGRLSEPANHSSSSNEKPRRKSCSPARVRAPVSTAQKTGNKISSRSRGSNNDGDDVNPVVVGTKMVDRVVNMRKLAPPKQDEYASHDNPKKSSQENSGGFGRSLSKKSLDMAIRHMDITRSIPDKLRTSASGSA